MRDGVPSRRSLTATIGIAHQRMRPFAQSGLFVLALLSAAYVTRSLSVPMAFAFMLYFLLRPAVRWLAKARLPKAIAAGVVLGGVLCVLGVTALELSGPASNWARRLPSALQELEAKSRALRRPVEKASHIADAVQHATEVVHAEKLPRVAVAKPGWLDGMIASAAELSGQVLLTIVTAYFLLLNGDTLLGRLFCLLPELHERERASAVINEVERRMSQYLRTVTAINVALGAALAIVLKLLGMPNPLLWAGMATILNYVPYLGPAVGIAVVGVAAFVAMPTASLALAAPLGYLALTSVEGNVITPMILGRAFRISPLVVFLWLAFWAWLWSVPGAILAVPMLMLLKIVCEQSAVFAPVAEFIRD
jgi:predicted PurR-regulated permease PerM